MQDLVFKKGEFTVLKKVRNGKHSFIVINTKKGFDKGHTHLNNYKQAVYIISCVKNKKIPKSFSKYLLISLIRLSADAKYTSEVEELINTREQKGKKANYHNQGGRKR